jgi:hypothetical protein
MSTTASVLIAGDYVDAYLYGGLLLAWDRRGRLVIASTEALAVAVADAVGSPRSVARAAFVDNKLLRGAAVRDRAQTSALSNVQNGDGSVTHLEMSDLRPLFFNVAPDAHVLDLMATYGRLFISTDDALLSAPFTPREVGKAVKRLSHRVLDTSPRWGAVSASCADAGAWALLNEVGFHGGANRRTEQIASTVSVRHSWSGSTLLSYDDDNDIGAFKALVPNERGKRRLAEGFVPLSELEDPFGFGWWLSADEDPLGLADAEFVTTFSGLLVAAKHGVIEAHRMSGWHGLPHPVNEPARIGRVEGYVMSIAETDGGFVVETDDELYYLADGEATKLISRETISLRAYPRSKRHRRAVTATIDGGLLVTALLGTHPLPPADRRIYPPTW